MLCDANYCILWYLKACFFFLFCLTNTEPFNPPASELHSRAPVLPSNQPLAKPPPQRPSTPEAKELQEDTTLKGATAREVEDQNVKDQDTPTEGATATGGAETDTGTAAMEGADESSKYLRKEKVFIDTYN